MNQITLYSLLIFFLTGATIPSMSQEFGPEQRTKIKRYHVKDKETGKLLFGFKDQTDSIIIEPAFDFAPETFNGQYLVIKPNKTKTCGVLDSTGQYVIALGRYQSLDACEGLYVYASGKFYGLVDRNGKEITKPIYSQCKTKNSSRFIGLTLNGYDAVYDCLKQSFLTDFKYPSNDINVSINDIGHYDSTGKEYERNVYYKGENKNGLIDWYNLTQSKMIDQEYSYILVDYNLQAFIVQKNDKWGLVTIHNEVKLPIVCDELISFNSKKAIVVVKSGKYTIMDAHRNLPISKEYDYIKGLGYDSMALVVNQGKIGLYNRRSFKEVVPCTYSDVRVYKADSILVKKDKAYGMIDKNGKVIHPFNWELIGIEPLDSKLKTEHYTYVYKQKKKYGFIKEGKYITAPIYDHITIDTLDRPHKYYICKRKDTLDCFSNQYYDSPFKLTGYDEVVQVTYKYIIVKKKNRYGILDTKDQKELTPIQFDNVTLDRYKNITVTQNAMQYQLLFKADKSFELKEIK